MGRAGRVVQETEILQLGRSSRSRWTIVPLPAPEGPEIMNKRESAIEVTP
jgi:hypothetical protein